jgi:thyrotropin-releasing hormone receptor
MNVSDIANASLNGSETVALMEPVYYSVPYRVIAGIFISIIFGVGLIGNTMVILVVWRTRSLHTPTNCYLLSLALADVLLLISAPLPTLVEIFLIIDQYVFGNAGCRIMVFLQYLGVNVSSLSMTFFTIERYMAICHPMKAQTMCTVSRAKRIIAGLWVFGICYCCPWFFLSGTSTVLLTDGSTMERCSFRLARNRYLIYYMADLMLFYVIPLLLTCVLYGLIAAILYSGSRPMSHAGTAKSVANGSQSGNRSQKSSTSSSRVQVRH